MFQVTKSLIKHCYESLCGSMWILFIIIFHCWINYWNSLSNWHVQYWENVLMTFEKIPQENP